MEITDLKTSIDISTYKNMSTQEWMQLLANEIDIYIYNNRYIGKRVDEINYNVISLKEAREIADFNVSIIMREKFKSDMSDEVFDIIQDIKRKFVANLSSSIHTVSFDKEDEDVIFIQQIPDYCIAFKNGVYNFKDNCWLFKYTKTQNILGLKTNHIRYSKYFIFWYLKVDFEPYMTAFLRDKDLSINDTIKNTICYKVMYNMCHDNEDRFSQERFNHLCQIMGYLIYQKFSDNFVILIGEGSNGKNTLFDGVFGSRLVPQPINNSLDYIEKNNFAAGTLVNRYHNFWFETEGKKYSVSENLKQLTGSPLQSVEKKGEQKTTVRLNVKWLFSSNHINDIKFEDTTVGFRRRANFFSLYWTYHSNLNYMKNGDYFDTTVSDDYHEIYDDKNNIFTFCYYAMYGLSLATNNFTKTFAFTENDFTLELFDADIEVKKKLNLLGVKDISLDDIRVGATHTTLTKILPEGTDLDLFKKEDFSTFLFNNYNNTCYVKLDALLKTVKFEGAQPLKEFKKYFPSCKIERFTNNIPYVRCKLGIGDKLIYE